MICSFRTDDYKYKYVSKLAIILIPDSMAMGDKNFSFITPHFKFISKKLIEDDELLNTEEDSVDLFI